MKLRKSVFAMTMSVCMACALFPEADALSFQNNQLQENTKQVEKQTVHNLVLFGQFKNDDANYNFMSEYTDDMLDYCEKADSFLSMAGYINEISYGQMGVDFVYPQMQGDVIVPYTMNEPLEKYTNIESIITEIISNTEISSESELDGNNDGIIDNIILVMDGNSDTMSSIFWPRCFSMYGMSVNDLSTGMINVHNSTSLFKNIISGGAGVLCHEFLHTVGYPDLYRNSSRTGTPVGMWDIMASNSVFVQYPLAYQRYKVSGWLDAKTITEDGTYTLSPASARNGNRLYLLKTPLSDTEFFAVEYRQQGKAYSEEMDVKIYGTGMVVYRVNTDVNGNYKSGNDEIYIFRPDETGLDAGEGDLYRSCYGGVNSPDSVGSLDFQATVQDGALVYSDGTNSGIKLSDIKINGDELTFKAEFADTSQFGLWKSITLPDWTESTFSLDLQVSEEGDLYLLTNNENGTIVSRYHNKEWEKYTSEMTEQAYDTKLCMYNDVPYILYNDSSEFTYVIKYYKDGKWNTLAKGSELSQYQDFAIHNDKLYLAYTTGSFPYALHVSSYDLKTGEIKQYEDGNTDVCNISITVNDDESIAVSYRGAYNGTNTGVDFWDNQGHRTLKLSDEGAGITKAVYNGNSCYVTSTEKACGLYVVEDDKTTAIPFSDTIKGNCYFAEPFVHGNDAYVTIGTQNEDDLSVYQYTDNSLKKIGNSLSVEAVNNPVSIAGKNSIYVAYTSAQGTVFLKEFDIGNSDEKVPGDVNSDKVFDKQDISFLKSWLLNSGKKLSDWTTADYDNSENLNVFDLCKMKQEYFNK